MAFYATIFFLQKETSLVHKVRSWLYEIPNVMRKSNKNAKDNEENNPIYAINIAFYGLSYRVFLCEKKEKKSFE